MQKINGVKMEEKEVLGTKIGLGIQILLVWMRDPFAAFVGEIQNQTMFWFADIAMELKPKNILAAIIVKRLEKRTKEKVGYLIH